MDTGIPIMVDVILRMPAYASKVCCCPFFIRFELKCHFPLRVEALTVDKMVAPADMDLAGKASVTLKMGDLL